MPEDIIQDKSRFHKKNRLGREAEAFDNGHSSSTSSCSLMTFTEKYNVVSAQLDNNREDFRDKTFDAPSSLLVSAFRTYKGSDQFDQCKFYKLFRAFAPARELTSPFSTEEVLGLQDGSESIICHGCEDFVKQFPDLFAFKWEALIAKRRRRGNGLGKRKVI